MRYERSMSLNFSKGLVRFDKITVNGLFSFSKSIMSVEFMRSNMALFLSMMTSPIFRLCVKSEVWLHEGAFFYNIPNDIGGSSTLSITWIYVWLFT